MKYTIEEYTYGYLFNAPNSPTSGSPNILVIPVWFTDSGTYLTSETYKSNVIEDIEKAFFGTSAETGWHSVSSYYKQASGGTLSMQGTVWKTWYECGYSSSQIANNSDGTYVNTIVENAANAYFRANPSDSRKNYDADGDGYIDAVSLIYACPTYDELGYEYNDLWAFCYWLQNPDYNVNNPIPNTYFWASYDFIYSPSTAASRTGNGRYYGGSTNGLSVSSPIDAHTYIHEFGHVLGLKDYYDYSGQCKPAGSFSMQDANVGGHDPFSMMTFGWVDPYIPTESCKITIGAFQTNKDLILLTPKWNGYDSPFDEYLLLELYTPTGLNELDSKYQYYGNYPKGPTQTGIRLWHVDGRLATYDEQNRLRGINQLTTCPVYYDAGDTYYLVQNAFTNTYWSNSDNDDYCTPFGKSYADYNQLQLIRNDQSETYKPVYDFEGADLFMDGDTFSMDSYSKQFVNGSKLNGGSALGWSFSVDIEGSGENATATITCTKA